MPLSHLIERSQGYDAEKVDYSAASVTAYYFNDACELVTPTSLDHVLSKQGFSTLPVVSELPMTEWALIQTCERLGAVCWPGSQRRLPSEYLMQCEPDLRAINLNRWVEKAPNNRKWFVRAYQGSCRAVLTDRFSVIDVTQALEWAQEILIDKGAADATLWNPVVTPDKLTLSVLFKDMGTPSGAFGIGVRVGTGEIGNSRIYTMPYIQRNSCTNSIVWQHEGAWEHIHTGDSQLLKQEFFIHLIKSFQASELLLKRFLDAEQESIPEFDELLSGMSERNNWSEGFKMNVVRGTEGEFTVAALVNGLTYAAQGLGQDEREKTEILAGDVLHGGLKYAADNRV